MCIRDCPETLSKTRAGGGTSSISTAGAAVQVSHTCANGKVITMTFVDPGVPRKANHFFNTAAKKAVAAVIAGDASAGCERPYMYDEVGRWMLTSEKLSKNRIGDYLGRTDEHAMATIDAFLGHLDFTPFVFDEALRFFLSLFKLPGEAQQIDRILQVYHRPNMAHAPPP